MRDNSMRLSLGTKDTQMNTTDAEIVFKTAIVFSRKPMTWNHVKTLKTGKTRSISVIRQNVRID